MVRMPGQSFQGETPTIADQRQDLRTSLEADVHHLSETIGMRSIARAPNQVAAAATFVENRFVELGYSPRRQEFPVGEINCANIEVEIPGSDLAKEIVVIGAHYDSFYDTPGANDNASGTAALLALAAECSRWQPKRTLRFVAFTNEEPPYFQGPNMGSLVYAKRCKKNNEQITAVISLETIGFFTDMKGSQQYPPPFGMVYPAEGNFIGVIGCINSRKLTHRVIRKFREVAEVPSEGGALPQAIPGVGWSDHWSFWQCGYDAVMITDTAPFRYRYYHKPEDTPDKLDFDRMTLVVDAMPEVIRDLVDN